MPCSSEGIERRVKFRKSFDRGLRDPVDFPATYLTFVIWPEVDGPRAHRYIAIETYGVVT